jgi:hypothetical protein
LGASALGTCSMSDMTWLPDAQSTQPGPSSASHHITIAITINLPEPPGPRHSGSDVQWGWWGGVSSLIGVGT